MMIKRNCRFSHDLTSDFYVILSFGNQKKGIIRLQTNLIPILSKDEQSKILPEKK